MKFWKNLPLLVKILIGIVLGVVAGTLLGHVAGAKDFITDVIKDGEATGAKELTGFGSIAVVVLRVIQTVGNLVGQLIRFFIPIILVGFIAAGIAELGKQAGKMLGLTVGLSYLSTIVFGLLAFLVGSLTLNSILEGVGKEVPAIPEIVAIFNLSIDPIFGSITALVLAFSIGIVAANKQGSTMYNILMDIRDVAVFSIEKIIIPLLPLSIFTVFTWLSFSDGIINILKIFGIVYLVIILLHWTMIFIHHTISAVLNGRSPFKQIYNVLPAYATAVGTQSSAVTMPITLGCAKKMGVRDDIAEFVVPLCANVHLPGSMITITMCAIAVSIIMGYDITLGQYLPFLFTLGIAMVAAPGVPGGAIMVASGFLVSMLGFQSAAGTLMIALYLAQDSFGTAGNVATDASIAAIVEKLV